MIRRPITTAFEKGGNMKRLILLLVAAAFVASPAGAATKQQKDKQTTEAEDIAKQHDNTRRALRDALRWCCQRGRSHSISA
jgi:Ni/Co efflux regulator RcnB